MRLSYFFIFFLVQFPSFAQINLEKDILGKWEYSFSMRDTDPTFGERTINIVSLFSYNDDSTLEYTSDIFVLLYIDFLDTTFHLKYHMESTDNYWYIEDRRKIINKIRSGDVRLVESYFESNLENTEVAKTLLNEIEKKMEKNINDTNKEMIKIWKCGTLIRRTENGKVKKIEDYLYVNYSHITAVFKRVK